MRKFILISLAFAFILLSFNFNTASAANCATGELFNTTTGERCVVSVVVECPTGDLFNSGTGERCNAWVDNSTILVNPQFQIGERGENVRAFQQVLKDKDFLVSGKVDGIYGPITAEAAARYYKQYTYVDVPPLCPLAVVDGVAMHVCPSPIFDTESPVISGVSGPQSLGVNQQGNWSITAKSSTGGNLSYSVWWGDENVYATTNSNAVSAIGVSQQSATFTHSYAQAGIYKPTFTVTSQNTIVCITTPCPSNAGTAQASLSVQVGETFTDPYCPPGTKNVGMTASMPPRYICQPAATN